MLVINVDAVEVVFLDEHGEGRDGVVDPRSDGIGIAEGTTLADGVTAKAKGYLDIVVLGFDAPDLGGAQIIRVPKDVKLAIRGVVRVGGGVVNYKGDEEMELGTGVYGDVGELDVIVLEPDVFSEDLGRRCG